CRGFLRLVREEGRESRGLVAALGALETEMCRDDPQPMPVGDDHGIDRAARLAGGKTDVVEPNPLDRLAGEQRIAEISTMCAQADAGRVVMPGRLREKRPLIDIACDAVLGVDLLQSDNIGIELADNLGDALRIKPSIHAAAS